MKFVIQRVQSASVTVDEKIVGKIGKGYLVLIGISQTDTKEIADKMMRKLINLRIFEDAEGKTNLDIRAVNGSLLLVSQFTLYADCKKGNRPSFVYAGKPDMANELYEYIIAECKKENGLPVLDASREKEKLDRVAEQSPAELREYTRRLYTLLIELSRDYQRELIGKERS